MHLQSRARKKDESVSVQGDGSNLQNLKKKKIINKENKWDDEKEEKLIANMDAFSEY